MVKQSYKIKAPIGEVWAALVDPKIIKQWSGSDAIMDDKENTDFKLWDGDIWGTNTKVEKDHLLEQDWYGGDWPKPSKLKLELNESGGITTIDLSHTELPESEEKDFANGWKDYYFGPVKELLENS